MIFVTKFDLSYTKLNQNSDSQMIQLKVLQNVFCRMLVVVFALYKSNLLFYVASITLISTLNRDITIKLQINVPYKQIQNTQKNTSKLNPATFMFVYISIHTYNLYYTLQPRGIYPRNAKLFNTQESIALQHNRMKGGNNYTITSIDDLKSMC